VQLLVAARQRREREKMSAALPLLRIIFEIDNTRSDEAKILAEYTYYSNEEENWAAVAKVLGLDRNASRDIVSYSSFIQFFKNTQKNFNLLVNEHRGKKKE
jgi:hypothetical protein